MFKGFTWAKFLGDVTTVVAITTGPLAGLIGNHTAAIIAAIGVAVRAIASAVTTVLAGTATTNAGGPAVNSK